MKAEDCAINRDNIIEECDLVVQRVIDGMAAHTNEAGMVTGEDFFFPEIEYLRDVVGEIRALKGQERFPPHSSERVR